MINGAYVAETRGRLALQVGLGSNPELTLKTFITRSGSCHLLGGAQNRWSRLVLERTLRSTKLVFLYFKCVLSGRPTLSSSDRHMTFPTGFALKSLQLQLSVRTTQDTWQ